MVTLELTAEKTMDLYYQQYKHKDDFFDIDDFIFYCSVAYANQLQLEYDRSYKQGKEEESEARAQLPQDWFQESLLNVKFNPTTNQYEGLLDPRPFSFKTDRSFSSIDDIYPVGSSKADFIRLGSKQEWTVRLLPTNPKTFWLVQGAKIVFKNVKGTLRQVRILYIPSLATLDPHLPIAEVLMDDIMRGTLDMMFKAKQGVPFVQMLNDSNPNGILQTEINPNYKIKTSQTV